MRPTGFEPVTYGLESNRAKNITTIDSIGYTKAENPFSTNFSENNNKIQEDLIKVIKRWDSLPPNIKSAIIVLIGSENE